MIGGGIARPDHPVLLNPPIPDLLRSPPTTCVSTTTVGLSTVPMASYEESRPLPKFGDWDVNDPASAEGFTVIFSKARNEKVAGGPSGNARSMQKRNSEARQQKPAARRWFCCGC
ncbi:hypothetical protein MLD38_011904 [Melastoma candidum]|uniref:Uncharacterized protein n=1 Tax=Melastoma candidum TaxID=119954 RepID=A0ACB9R3Z5_9MYRT|nr:hypothetical protein MLD38_011904 [Melastoma candidum]